MSDYSVRFLTEEEFENWDKLVSESQRGTLFHKVFWLKASNLPFKIIGCFSADNEILAGIPITYQKKLGFTIVRPPFLTPYLGIVFKDNNSKYVSRISKEKELMISLVKKIKENMLFAYIELGFDFSDLQPFIWQGFSSRVHYTYLLSIENLEATWDNMDAKRRNDIKRAEKDGIIIKTSTNFDETFALVEKTFGRQDKSIGFKSIAYRYDESTSQNNQSRSFLAVNKDGKAIATVYIVWDEKRSYYLLGGYDNERSHHGASALAIWEAIKFTKECLGLNEFDLEGSMVPQIEQFFRKFGGRLTPCYTVVWGKPYIEPLWFGYEILRKRNKYSSFESNHTV